MKNKKWRKEVARNYYPLHMSATFHQLAEGLKLGSIRWRLLSSLIIKNKKPLTYYFLCDDNLMETNFEYHIKNKNKEIEDFLLDAEKSIESDLKLKPGHSLKDIHFLYKRFKFETALMIMSHKFVLILESLLKNKLDKKAFTEIKDEMFLPHKKTIIAREHEEIINIKKRYSSNKLKDLEIEAKRLANKFGFIHSEYKAKERDFNDYIDEIKAPLVYTEFKETIKLFDEHKLDEYSLWLVNVAKKCTYIFDEAKSAAVRTNWALRKTLYELDADENKIMSCNEEEFFEWIKNDTLPEEKILNERNKYYALLLWNGKLTEYSTKKEISNLIEQEGIDEFDEIKEKIDKIKGSIACKGYAKGKVKIIYSHLDIHKMEKGNILVASMTTPELVTAMRKASAFVTDEGGILCHAAIIAREMNKPCITGTKIATKVFKDGDLVEVDANKGVVKKLK